MNNLIQFNVVECVESGEGFIKGCYYAQVGTNNGIQIVREGKGGDCETHLFCTGGIGKGDFNSWDGTGSPSFVHREVKIK